MELTVTEAATRLGISRQAVSSLLRRGKITGRKVIPVGKSPLQYHYLIDEQEVARYQSAPRDTGGGWRRGYDPEETARMEAAGYLTTAEAAREIGGVRSDHLTKYVEEGRVAGIRKHITFIHRDEVARLKRAREEKIARIVSEQNKS